MIYVVVLRLYTFIILISKIRGNYRYLLRLLVPSEKLLNTVIQVNFDFFMEEGAKKSWINKTQFHKNVKNVQLYIG